MVVTLMYFDGCPNWRYTKRLLDCLPVEFDCDLRLRLVSTPQEAEQVGFRGSPTVLIDGVDPFADRDAPTGLACRIFATPEGLRGSPTVDLLRSVLATR
ncbi:MAG: thioredoxin family protein [Acidimicrobiia bacterium]